MKTQKQQEVRPEQLNNYCRIWHGDANECFTRQGRGRPESTIKRMLSETKTILNHINYMRTQKRRKRSPGLLRYSSGRWHDEAQECQFLPSRRQSKLIEYETQKEIKKEIKISTL